MFRNGLKINFDWIPNMVQWIVAIILLIAMYSMGHCQEKGEAVDVYHKNKYQFSMSYDEFNTILNSAKQYSKQLDAENNKRVIIELKDDVWTISDKVFKSKIKIKWLNEKKETIKEMNINVTIDKTDYNNKPSIEYYYTETAKYGFPIMFMFSLLLILL